MSLFGKDCSCRSRHYDHFFYFVSFFLFFTFENTLASTHFSGDYYINNRESCGSTRFDSYMGTSGCVNTRREDTRAKINANTLSVPPAAAAAAVKHHQ